MCRDAPPIDQAGNIHFGTESGNYYIIKPTRSDDQLVLKKDLAAMIAESGFSNSSGWTAGEGKIWSSPTIGPDGTIYIGITNNTNASSSLLVALYDEGITGPAASAWPMRGKNHRHTSFHSGGEIIGPDPGDPSDNAQLPLTWKMKEDMQGARRQSHQSMDMRPPRHHQKGSRRRDSRKFA